MHNRLNYPMPHGKNWYLRGSQEAVYFPPPKRKYIGVLFECCDVYTRIYISKKKAAYIGWCPKCAHRIEIKIDKQGTNSRFFRAR